MGGRLRLGFTGDVMLGRLVDEHQRQRPVTAVWGDLRERLSGLDGLFVNLECCLSDRGEPWRRTYRPFLFRASPDWAVPALADVGVDYASLANNHVLDYGEQALLDTLDALDDAGIAHAGAGRTRAAARQPAVVDLDGLTVAVVSLTDNTPEYAADSDAPGTAHVTFDRGADASVAVLEAAIEAATEADPDLVVASLHWGPNMVERPPEAFEEFAAWLTDRGVDVVHGHSAHLFQGVEVRDGAVVCYDTGDFVDDYAVDPDLYNDRSFLFEVEVATDPVRLERLRLVPTEIRDFAVHQAPPPVAAWSRDRMRRLSEPYGTAFDREDEALVTAVRE